MASSYYLNICSSSSSSSSSVAYIPKIPSSTCFQSSIESCGYNGISIRRPSFDFTTHAKFDKFDGPSLNDNSIQQTQQQQLVAEEEQEEDDR